MRQCPSCGGVCRKSGCERANVYSYPVPAETHQKALEVACHYHNRCCDLEEIIEMFCMDSERHHGIGGEE